MALVSYIRETEDKRNLCTRARETRDEILVRHQPLTGPSVTPRFMFLHREMRTEYGWRTVRWGS